MDFCRLSEMSLKFIPDGRYWLQMGAAVVPGTDSNGACMGELMNVTYKRLRLVSQLEGRKLPVLASMFGRS